MGAGCIRPRALYTVAPLPLEDTPSGSASNVDRFHYDLSVTAGDQRHQLSAGGTELSPALRQLLDELLRR